MKWWIRILQDLFNVFPLFFVSFVQVLFHPVICVDIFVSTLARNPINVTRAPKLLPHLETFNLTSWHIQELNHTRAQSANGSSSRRLTCEHISVLITATIKSRTNKWSLTLTASFQWLPLLNKLMLTLQFSYQLNKLIIYNNVKLIIHNNVKT